MHQQLLPETDSHDAGSRHRHRNMPALPRRLRGGMDDVTMCCAGATACCTVVLIILASLTTASLSPNEYGILLNTVTGELQGEAVRGGLHFRAPWQSFMKFPATQVTMVYAKYGHDWKADLDPIPALVVQTENGGDHSLTLGMKGDGSDEHGGSGQPINISCAVQFKYNRADLKKVYKKFRGHDKAKARFLMIAKTSIISSAQAFSPQQFWQDREAVAKAMLDDMNVLLKEYWIKAVGFEILKLEFKPTFEASLVKTQVEAQKIIVKQYAKKVTTVLTDIKVLNSENEAHIAEIKANAARKAKEMKAQASQDAFDLKQTTKAESYAGIKKELNFTNDHMKEYFKIKALLSQSANGPVVINVPQPEECDAK